MGSLYFGRICFPDYFDFFTTFQWTPDPPPKKKKSKKAGKKSLLTGFGPGAAHEDKSEDVSSVLKAFMIH